MRFAFTHALPFGEALPRFNRFSVTQGMGGLVIAAQGDAAAGTGRAPSLTPEDQPQAPFWNRGFLSFIGLDSRPVWHRDDIPNTGVVTFDNGGLFTRVQDRILALDATTGAIRWSFPRQARPLFFTPSRAFPLDSGLVVKEGRVYGQVGRRLVALDQSTGEPLWEFPLATPEGLTPGSLVASSEYLFGAEHDRIFALRLKDGKPAWMRPLILGGSLYVANGMLFLWTGKSLNAFAPAERTFRIAADSSVPGDYSGALGVVPEDPEEKPAPPAAPGMSAADEADAPVPTQKPSGAVADASVLRLEYPQAHEALVTAARQRREAVKDVPLLISIDWQDSSLNGAQLPEIGAFAEACRRVAREASPEYLDVAPEVNVLLARSPARLEYVRALISAARAAVRGASSNTRVLVSLNVEVLTSRYGDGPWKPFATVPERKTDLPVLAKLLEEVDAVGLTSRPQSAFDSPVRIPGDYFLGLLPALARKPVLITRLEVRITGSTPRERQECRVMARRLLQLSYWMNAQLTVYPDLDVEGADRAGAVRRKDEALARSLWADVPHWKRVEALTASAARSL